MTRTPAIMVLGTGSHVGKSLITAALCRAVSRAGFRVAPFKAQNMSLNSAATPERLEIGRAQAMQAEAAGIPASVHMNPVLLKPSDTASQVILRGKIFAQFSAEDYFKRKNKELLPLVSASYEILAAQYELIILEGAGSPAEINLKDRDIVNLRMAHPAGARCILVRDIDRGGVFASIFGTLALLEPSERDLIDGFVINKFRGDVRSCGLESSNLRSASEDLASVSSRISRTFAWTKKTAYRLNPPNECAGRMTIRTNADCASQLCGFPPSLTSQISIHCWPNPPLRRISATRRKNWKLRILSSCPARSKRSEIFAGCARAVWPKRSLLCPIARCCLASVVACRCSESPSKIPTEWKWAVLSRHSAYFQSGPG
jgi:dethiobiotin synthetase